MGNADWDSKLTKRFHAIYFQSTNFNRMNENTMQCNCFTSIFDCGKKFGRYVKLNPKTHLLLQNSPANQAMTQIENPFKKTSKSIPRNPNQSKVHNIFTSRKPIFHWLLNHTENQFFRASILIDETYVRGLTAPGHCMGNLIFANILGLNKKGSNTRPKWSWKLFEPDYCILFRRAFCNWSFMCMAMHHAW